MALTLASTVKAHAYVTNWVIDGETLNGYNPTWDDPANVPTGTRPTDNANTGEQWIHSGDEYTACSHLKNK